MNDLSELRNRFSSVPVNQTLEFDLKERELHRAIIAMPAHGSYAQEEGVIQGGILIALADTSAVYGLYPDLPEGKTMTSIESKMNYLRPAIPGLGEITAHSRVIKSGRNVAVSEVTLFQKDKQLAVGLFTYLIYDRRV